jgi:hypothetical protein
MALFLEIFLVVLAFGLMLVGVVIEVHNQRGVDKLMRRQK